MKSLIKKEQGFTLIEIVIVLAIAAAIMLMVFLAVQGARKTQRDTQRRTDAARIAATLDQYAANNGGKYPTVGTGGAIPVTPGTWWADYVAAGNFTAPGSTTSYAAGFGYTAGVVPATATISPDTVYAAVANGTNKYQVCIGGEATNRLCATSS